MVSRDEIEQIIEQTDIVALVSEYVTLEKTGKNYRGLCPFHNEKTPSFFVSPEKHLAHCFSCGKGGNPIQFLMDIKNISFVEALDNLAKRNGMNINLEVKTKKENNYTKYYEINQTSTDFYKRNLTGTSSGQKALEYLHKRGIDDETIKTFDIGLSSTKPNLLYSVLHDANYLELDMMDLGLVKKGTNGYYDLFTRRIMFPIRDEESRVIGFSGRVYMDVDSGQPKYVNSPETFLFKKGFALYNLDKAIPAIIRNKRVILHEGFMDVIASYNAGLKETVCSMGTALTIEQANLLKKYTDSAIVCYDGDAAGVKASLKAIKVFNSVGMKIHLLLLPDGNDPDEYVKKYGKDKYLEFFNANLVDAYEYIFTQAIKRDLNDALQAEACKKLVFDTISASNSNTIVEKYLSRLSDVMKVSIASLYMDYNNYYKAASLPKSVEKTIPSRKNEILIQGEGNSFLDMKKSELRIINYATISKEKALYIDSLVGPECFEPKNRKIWMELIDVFYMTHAEFNRDEFYRSLSDENKRCYEANMIALDKSIKEQYTDTDLEACISKLKQQKFALESKIIDEKMKKTQGEEQIELLAKKFGALKQYDDEKKKGK